MGVAMTRDAAPSEAQLLAALDLIEARLQPEAILIYGSLAGGRLSASSDVDLGLLLGHREVDPFSLAQLRVDLEAVLAREVDLVNLDHVSPILAMQVLRRHRVARLRSPAAFDAFIARTTTAYADLKRTRRPIEDAMRQRAVRA
jgi:predicted nucleotidyltransferase